MLNPAQTAEIKLKKPGLLKDHLSPSEHLKKPPIDDLIVFGQGPVIDVETREKPTEQTKQEDVNMWAKNIARAAGELKLAGVVRKIILTGGRTGGAGFLSEAELMKKILVEEYEIFENEIAVETKATNTLENFAYTLNSIDEEGKKEPQLHRTVGVLGADFHLTRIQLLAELFGLKNTQGFSAEQIFRLIAYKTGDSNLHQKLDRLLGLNDDLSAPESRLNWSDFQKLTTEEKAKQESKSTMRAEAHFERFSGEDKKGIVVRWAGEQRWTRGLKEIPTYWIGYLGYLKDDNRLLSLLQNQFSQELLTDLGINLSSPVEVIREKLLEYTKENKRGIPPKSWEKS